MILLVSSFDANKEPLLEKGPKSSADGEKMNAEAPHATTVSVSKERCWLMAHAD